MKLIWTSSSAAKELGISTRTLNRCLGMLNIRPAKPQRARWHGGQTLLYILGVEEMRRLRKYLNQN